MRSNAYFRAAFAAVFLCAALSALAAEPAGRPLDLTILHVNDTHSMLEPSSVRLTMDLDDSLTGKTVYMNFGGFPTAMTALARLRAESGNTLFLHAGDFFQGSLYFTKYLGAADVDFWNAMRVDVATLGNHEFDKGPGLLQTALLGTASFAVTSANVDLSGEPAITSKDRLKPFVIREIGGEKVGIIGVTTPETPYISSPGKNISFRNAAEAVNAAAAALAIRGVNKIVLLSHIGIDADKALASLVRGVDVIVGGHSHTLLGSSPSLGLKGMEQYPVVARDAEGADVLIVQAWQWAHQIGRIRVSFDPEGKVVSYRARPVFVVNSGFARIYDLPNLKGEKKRVQFSDREGKLSISEYDGSKYANAVTDDPKDPADQYDAYAAVYRTMEGKLKNDPNVLWTAPDSLGQVKLASYSGGVAELKNRIVATVAEEMQRGHNSGPGPVIADSMSWKTGAQVAIMNPGGVRVDLAPGDLSVARVYELQPFGNTLVTLSVTGNQLAQVLEDMADFTITSYGTKPGTHFLYVSGMTLSLDTARAKGYRISDVRIRQADGSYAPLSAGEKYSLAVNNFMAAGGDKNFTLAGLPGKYDTGFIDSEAMLAYVEKKTLSNLTEERVKLVH
jgi:5'-nucleotidase